MQVMQRTVGQGALRLVMSRREQGAGGQYGEEAHDELGSAEDCASLNDWRV